MAAVACVISSNVAAGRFSPPTVSQTHSTLSTQAIFSQRRSVRHASRLRGGKSRCQQARPVTLRFGSRRSPGGGRERAQAAAAAAFLLSSQPSPPSPHLLPYRAPGVKLGRGTAAGRVAQRRRRPLRPGPWGSADTGGEPGPAGAREAALRGPQREAGRQRRGRAGRAGPAGRQGRARSVCVGND